MKVTKNSLKHTGRQNFLCRACGKQFQFVYQKAGCTPKSKQLVVRITSIRDIKKVKGVHQRTVLRWLNQKADSLQVILDWQHTLIERLLLSHLKILIHSHKIFVDMVR